MTIQEIQQKTAPIFTAYGVKRAALFGSFARGEMHQHSDIDLLVELAPGMSLLDLSGLKLELQEALERNVDIVQDKKIRPEFAPFIYKDQKELFTHA